jgi:hypothetical protein
MTSQGTARGRFGRAIHRRHVQAAEMAAREMGGLTLLFGESGSEFNFGYTKQVSCSP